MRDKLSKISFMLFIISGFILVFFIEDISISYEFIFFINISNSLINKFKLLIVSSELLFISESLFSFLFFDLFLEYF